MSIVLSLYLNKFGYGLRGYSHRECYRASDRKESTERRRVEVDNKEPADGQMVLVQSVVFCQQMNFDYIVDKINIDYSHRELFMRVAKDKSDVLYIESVKQGCKI
jgi:hypothetical protein